MASGKIRTVYVCSECGQESARWAGRCPECNAWNTFAERTTAPLTPAMGRARPTNGAAPPPVRMADLSGEEFPRIPVDIPEFDRVLGGGIVPGSLILIGGDPGIGKCVVGSTRILDPLTGAYAPITARQADRATVLSLDDSSHRLAPAPVAAFHDQGTRPVVEVKTRLGHCLRCTASHPILTPDGWMAVGDLPVGTRIAAPRSLPYFGHEEMEDHEVRMIAYALSDGSATSQVSVTATLPEIEADLIRVAEAFGVQLRTYAKRDTRAKQYRFVQPPVHRAARRREVADALQRVHREAGLTWAAWARAAGVDYGMLNSWRRAKCAPSSSVARFLQSVGLRHVRSAEKAVPDCIFRLPRQSIALFLKVLFSCDGSVFVNQFDLPGISYSTISHRLAEDVQHLLLRFGFVARLRTKNSRAGGRPYTAYEIQVIGVAPVRRFLAEIEIWGREEAKVRIAKLPEPRLPSTHWDTVPTGARFWSLLREATAGESFSNVSRQAGVVIRDRRHDRPLTRHTVAALARSYPVPFLTNLADGDIYWDEIQSITPVGEEPVYDLSVPAGESFVANDLIVHNSTLVAQVAAMVSTGTRSVLYVSGEESAHQIRLRSRRLGIAGDQIFLLTETNLTDALAAADRLQPDLLIVDSIQTVYAPELQNAPGSVAQLRECTMRLMQWAKRSATPAFLIGHVTKEGEIAGPRLLEHIVDVVLYLEGERFSNYRLLRGVKNRFGAVSEVGVFEMLESGLVGVENPSEVFLAERQQGAIGSAIVPAVEGSRPLLVEAQALASPSAIPTPRRTAAGIEFTRLLLIAAVLTKRAGVRLSDQDIIVNIVGGLKVNEPAADLGVALAIASSYHDALLPGDMVAIGEIGLSGELRSVSHLDRRLAEAEKLGFRSALVPRVALRRGRPTTTLELITADTLREALDKVCSHD